MLGGVGLGANQAEDPVGQMRGAGPDLLAIDHPLIAIEHGAGAQARQVAAGAGFGIPLAPDGVAAQGGRDELALLGLGADFQQRGHQHRDALSAQAGADPRAGEFLGDDARFEDVGFEAGAAVLLGYGARRVAMLDQQALPGLGLLVPRARDGGRLVAMRGQEGKHFRAEGLVLRADVQIHGGIAPVRVTGRRRNTTTAPVSGPTPRPAGNRPAGAGDGPHRRSCIEATARAAGRAGHRTRR